MALSRPTLYVDARVWIDTYARKHGDESPMDLKVFLPAGRKPVYYYAYYHERTTNGRDVASLKVFLEAWRIELPWVVVCVSECKFTTCGLCDWLRLCIDTTPRSQPELLTMYKNRLGAHFDFQAAQRVAQAL